MSTLVDLVDVGSSEPLKVLQTAPAWPLPRRLDAATDDNPVVERLKFQRHADDAGQRLVVDIEVAAGHSHLDRPNGSGLTQQFDGIDSQLPLWRSFHHTTLGVGSQPASHSALRIDGLLKQLGKALG